MKIRVITFALFIAIIIAGCERAPTYNIPEILFAEIINADNPLEPRIRANNWEALEALGKAYRAEKNILRARAVFTTFFQARFDPEGSTFSTKHYDILIEYAVNLLTATPENGVLFVYYDEVYYLARFAQEVLGVRPETPIVWAKMTPFKDFRTHLEKRYDMALPDELSSAVNTEEEDYKIAVQRNAFWFADSSGMTVYFNLNVPQTAHPIGKGTIYGTGIVYGADLSEKEIIELELRLFGEIFIFDAVSDTTITYPDKVRSLIDWYSDAPLGLSAKWMAGGDTTSADSLIYILIDRLPSQWKPASACLLLHPELPDTTRIKLLRQIERYIRLNPNNRSAKGALIEIMKTRNPNEVI